MPIKAARLLAEEFWAVAWLIPPVVLPWILLAVEFPTETYSGRTMFDKPAMVVAPLPSDAPYPMVLPVIEKLFPVVEFI